RKDEMSETPFEAPETAPEPLPGDEPASPSEETPGEGEGEEEEAAEEEGEQSEQTALEGEPEPEQEEPQGLSPRELQQRDDKVEKALPTHPRRGVALHGAHAPNLPPIVISPSAPPGSAHKSAAGRVPGDVQRPVLLFFGMPVEAE